MQSWLEGRNCVGKCAQATGMSASLRILSSKADSNTWESFTRSELKLESVHQESPRSDVLRKGLPSHFWNRNIIRSILPGLRRKKTGLLLSGPKSEMYFSDERKFSFSFENQGLGSEEEWRDTESMLLEVQWEVSTVCDDLGCHVICWCWSTVFSEVHSQRSHLPGTFRALHASFCWQALWDGDFIFQQDLAPAHTAKGTKSWFNDHGVTVLDWPANSPDLNPA